MADGSQLMKSYPPLDHAPVYRRSEEIQRQPCAKPGRGETVKAVKARKGRTEAKVKKDVREQCVERDGFCRVFSFREDVYQRVGSCEGLSQHAHLGKARRCHTRGMDPEARHSTTTSAMLCDRHHDAYDEHKFDLEPVTDKGADGPMRLVKAGFAPIEV